MTLDCKVDSPRAEFQSTLWTTVLAAGDERDPRAAEALERLCCRYWFPLYAYVRRQGYGPDDAADLVQGFLFHLLQMRRHLAALRRERGRFRSFLLISLKRFLINEHAKAAAAKRGGGCDHIPIDGSEAERLYDEASDTALRPDELYDRQWAIALLTRALDRLQEEALARGEARYFEAFRPFLMEPAPRDTYPELAAELGLDSARAAMLAYRLRSRYRALVREEVLATVANALDSEDEIRSLLAALSS